MDRLTKDIKISDKCRDFNWIKEQHELHLLKINGITPTTVLFEQLRLFVKTTEDVYSNHWDFDIIVSKSTKESILNIINITGIIIHFPLIPLTNSKRQKHTIKDIFIRMTFGVMSNPSRLVITDIQGGRMSVSYAEFCSSYVHSHLRTRDYARENSDNNQYPFWQSFCTGSGEINRFKMDLNGDGFTEERIIRFLLQLYTLLAWESIEGTPYNYIANITIREARNDGRINRTIPTSAQTFILYNKIKEHYRTTNTVPRIEFAIDANNKITIVDSPLFEHFVLNFPMMTLDDKKNFLFRHTPENGLVNYVDDNAPVIPGKYAPIPTMNSNFIFKGDIMPFTIEPNPIEVKEDKKEKKIADVVYQLHPTTKEYLIKTIEHEVNINKIRKSTIDRYSSETSNA